MGWRSLKVIETGTIWKLRCGFLFTFYINYGDILCRLWDIASSDLVVEKRKILNPTCI